MKSNLSGIINCPSTAPKKKKKNVTLNASIDMVSEETRKKSKLQEQPARAQ